MDTVFTFEFKNNVTALTSELLLWKCANPLSKLRPKIVDGNIECDSHTLYNVEDNVLVSENTLLFIEFDKLENKSVLTFLDFMNTRSLKRKIVPIEIDEEFEFVDAEADLYAEMYDNDDNLSIITRNFRKRVNSASVCVKQISKDENGVQIFINLPRIKYDFVLTMNDGKMEIEFIGKQPYKLFNTLICDYVHDSTNSNPYDMVRYIAETLTGDPDSEITLNPDIDNIMLRLYVTCSVTIKEYTWDDTIVTCPVDMSITSSGLMLMACMKNLYKTLNENKETIVAKHLYIVVPVIAFYVNIMDIDCMINNIKYYEILMKIIKLFDKVWDIDIACNITNILPEAKSNMALVQHHALMQEYLDKFD